MYQVHVINSDGADAGLAGIHPEILGSFQDREDAEEFASQEATGYELGCAVFDPGREMVHWGTDPDDPGRELVTYQGRRLGIRYRVTRRDWTGNPTRSEFPGEAGLHEDALTAGVNVDGHVSREAAADAARRIDAISAAPVSCEVEEYDEADEWYS